MKMMTAPVLLMGLIINYLLHNALHEFSINNVPCDTGSKLAPEQSQKKTNNVMLCYVWRTLAGPIQNYLNNPLFKYWFPETHDFYTTARNFFMMTNRTSNW
jgi:hypothetical protein